MVAVVSSLVGCGSDMVQHSENGEGNLMDNIRSTRVAEKEVDENFIKSTADFSIELFKKSLKDNENSLLSPTSVMLALAMTTNGADGETLKQLGSSTFSVGNQKTHFAHTETISN